MRTVLLLVCSNVFMTVAWYGHLKFKRWPLLLVIALSWLIALPEYALQVPANRFGYGRFSANQLKIIQEAISIAVFILFSILYLREAPSWRTGAAFALIFAAVILAVSGKPVASVTDAPVAAQSSESPLEVRR
jgi:uncharacterized protein (DUF486 family)